MPKYNWPLIIETVKELLPQFDDFMELARAIEARFGVPRTTLSDGLKRELSLSSASMEELRTALLPEDKRLSPLAQSLLAQLRKQRDTAFSMLDLVEHYDRSPSSIQAAASELYGAGYAVDITEDMHVIMPKELAPSVGKIPMSHWADGNVHRYGVMADTHLANRCERLDVMEAAYDLFEAEGIKLVLHAGNMVDGEFKWNRSELLAHGVEGQLCYAADNYPQREGIQTDFLSAECHEGWWGKSIGFDIGRHMENTFHELGRTDLVWMGHVERDLALHEESERCTLRVFHPGGGSAYALSYPVQKHVEAWQGGEKPTACIFGHYHKYDANYVREVYCLQPGTQCDQTIFMRKKKLPAHVGFCILEIHLTPYGAISRVKHEWCPFYDRGYYSRIWDYRSMYEGQQEAPRP